MLKVSPVIIIVIIRLNAMEWNIVRNLMSRIKYFWKRVSLAGDSGQTLRINEPVHEISNNVVCATSKASDQPAHTRSLIRAFARCLSMP